MKSNFLLEFDLSGIINCNTFSAAPSLINIKNKRNDVPLLLFSMKFPTTSSPYWKTYHDRHVEKEKDGKNWSLPKWMNSDFLT
jgi:hypothetical protein